MSTPKESSYRNGLATVAVAQGIGELPPSQREVIAVEGTSKSPQGPNPGPNPGAAAGFRQPVPSLKISAGIPSRLTVPNQSQETIVTARHIILGRGLSHTRGGKHGVLSKYKCPPPLLQHAPSYCIVTRSQRDSSLCTDRALLQRPHLCPQHCSSGVPRRRLREDH